MASYGSTSKLLALVFALFALLSTSASTGEAFFGFGGPAEVTATNGEVRLPLAEVNDGKAHFFAYFHENTPIHFFLVKDGSGTLRVAFDACDVCFKEKKGYELDGTMMTCRNCGMRFPLERIGEESGGCNPSRLSFDLSGETVVIKATDIESGLRFFK